MAESKTTTKRKTTARKGPAKDRTARNATGSAQPAAATKGPMSKREAQSHDIEGGPPTSKHGGVDPEWHNDPERLLGAEELEAMEERNDGEGPQVKVATYTPVSHQEIVINFTKLPPEVDFEVKITGPIAGSFWATLKSDPWGQAQLIRSFPAGGDYTLSAKGPGVDLEHTFTVAGYNEDREYRRQKRERIAGGSKAKGKGKGKGKSKASEQTSGPADTVEDPLVMGDITDGNVKAQPTEEELDDPEKFEPAFQPAEPQPVDGDEPDGKQKTDGDDAEKEKK